MRPNFVKIMKIQMTEQELAEALKDPARRREAFSLVIQQYQENLYWQIRKLVIIHDDAADILQDTLLRAWSKLDDFRGDSKLSVWLYSIARNQALTFLRKRQEEQELTLDDPDGYLMDCQEAAADFDGDEAQRVLNEALATLPAKQREVFCLRYFDEKSYEEISQITGTSVGALKASYHFAQEKIEKFVKKREL